MKDSSIFLQLFGAGGIVAMLVAIVGFLSYLSNHKKNKQDGYSKVFQDQNTIMATVERERDKAKEENEKSKDDKRKLERQINAILIFVKNLVSSLEDDEKINTQEAYQYRNKIQELEFSE